MGFFAEKLLVVLRDGRKLVGILRSFDQFANVVLEQAIERIMVGELYCDLPLGLYIIRGENVVLIGELVRAQNPDVVMKRILSNLVLRLPGGSDHGV
jgi:U6 snRNA-associated Sm-like protein LSm1